ncbi:hypothetical protein NQ317_005742 [Molorchus minor]|uniref:Cullin family profile domain-containing protein n=1 Tax=Molorchus minor TaxID=1323400 RepID=A0ABQ9JMD0_9CUCU|nr:hypothetical protein NQ317_005742 [Molorchus minor]
MPNRGGDLALLCHAYFKQSLKGMPEYQTYAEMSVRSLEFSLIAILNYKQPEASLQELYQIIENLHNTHRNVLYQKLHDVLEQTLQQKLESLLNNPEDMSILAMLSELQIYDDIFQQEFLKVSHVFYIEEGNFLIMSMDIREYLKHTQIRIKEEQERSKNYLNKYTSTAVLETVYKNLIEHHLISILQKTFNLLFENKIIGDELGILYNLVKKVPLGVKHLSDSFIEYISKKGVLIVNKPDNEKNMIQDLMDFKDKLDYIVERHFRGNDIFNDIIRNSFVKVINNKQNKPAQLLAKFIDAKLRSKDISDEVKIFLLLFTKKDLAKRLLLGKSTSQDAEDSMIGKLKAECGGAFTSKIEGMFKDINISQSMNFAFKQHLNHSTSTTLTDLSINVLTSSFWPNYPTYDVNLPSELVNYQPNLGHCIVKALFEKGNKELQVSLFQTIVLLLFNNANQLSFNEIQELTNLECEELKRTLISLACGKSKVLIRQLKGKDLENEDIFYFNSKFSDKLFRVKINQIQLKETIEEEQATEKSVLADRQFQIDAAIVRILKNRKKISHNELISKLFNALNIPVKPYDLKKRIELLIEREYLERDKDDPSNYTYIA